MREPSATPTKSATGAKLGFPKSSRILRAAEFRAIYDHGLRISGPLFAAFCKKRAEADPGKPGVEKPAGDGARLGLTVPRAVGKAVVRNRIKRRLRSAFRLHRAEFGAHWDIVLNPRRAALDASFAAIERALARVIEKCGP